METLIWLVFVVGGIAPFAAMGWRLYFAAPRPVVKHDEPPIRLPDASETADAVRRFHRAVDRYLLSEGLKPDDWRGV